MRSARARSAALVLCAATLALAAAGLHPARATEVEIPAPAASPTGEPLPPLLTLEEAIASALSGNRDLVAARLEAEKADHRLAATRTYRLPSVSLNFQESLRLTDIEFTFEKGSLGNLPNVGPVPDQDETIATESRPVGVFFAQAAQPLTQLWRLGRNVKMAEVDSLIAAEDLRLIRQQTGVEVRKGYYAVVQAASALAAADESVRLLRELDRVTAERLARKTALEADSLEVRARLAEAEHETLRARHAADTARESLNDLMGRAVDVPFRVEETPEPGPYERDLAASRARALEMRPEVREARLRISQAEYDRSAKKSEYFPDVSFTLTWLSFSNIEMLPRNVSTVGLMLTWDPLDWGRRQRELAMKSATVDQAETGLRAIESKVEVEIGSRWRALEESRSYLGVTALARRSVAERSRVAASLYAESAALLKDVLDAQAALAEANHRHQEALLAFWTNRAEFEKALGED